MKLYFFALVCILLLECKTDKNLINKDLINLYPKEDIIKKEYYKYNINQPFFIDNKKTLFFTRIEPSTNQSNHPKILIPIYDPHDDYKFYQFIEKKMGGNYLSYITKNDSIVFRHYIMIYSKNAKNKLTTKTDFIDYLRQKKIGFKFLKSKNNGYAFLLKKGGQKDSALCSIVYENNVLESYIYYNAKDTIKSFINQSRYEYVGNKLEY